MDLEARDSPAGPVPLLAMGCRWSLDLSSLPADEVEPMRARWARCAQLAEDPEALVLAPEVEPITVRLRDTEAVDDAVEGVVVPVDDPEHLPYDLSRAVTRRAITRLRGGGSLLLHAAAISEGGRALVLVAPSGGGKSTAARRLAQTFGYVTDESVVLTESLDLAPYPKPPSIIVDPAQPHLKDEPPPDEVGMQATPGAVVLGALLGLQRDADATVPEIVEVDLVDHLLTLIPETSSLWLVPGSLDRLARAATHHGPPASLRYAEIEDCMDLVRDILAQESTVEPWWTHLPPDEDSRWLESAPPLTGGVDGDPGSDVGGDADTGTDGTAGPDDPVTYVRAPWSDALEDGGTLLVLQGSRVVRVEGILSAIWRACATPRSRDEILAAVVDEHGPHQDADDLVRQALDALTREHLVHRTDAQE